MKEYLVFIHSDESAMVAMVQTVTAYSRWGAMKKLHKMGFKKKRF